MDRGPAFNGRNFLITVVVGLVLFTLISMFVTLGIGRAWGNAMNKKALEHERELQAQKMRDKETSEKH